jgi:hypothetical protein
VQGAGDQFLAGAAFAGHQHRGAGVGDGADQIADLLHVAALADHFGFVAQLRAQAAVFAFGVLVLEGALDDDFQFSNRRVGALLDVAVGPLLHRFHSVLDAGVGGDHDNGGLGGSGADGFEQFEAVHARHLDIRKHQVEVPVFQLGEGGARLGSGVHVVALAGEGKFGHLPDIGVVVNYQNALVRHGRVPRYEL